MQFRVATAADIESAIMPIEVLAYDAHWTEAVFAQELRNEWSTIDLLELDGVVAGYVVRWLVVDELHILNVAVAPAFRRRGLGRKLVEHAIGAAVSAGAAVATLEVRAGNVAAIALYSAIGFRRTGLRKKYYADNGEDAVLMGLLIGSDGPDPREEPA